MQSLFKMRLMIASGLVLLAVIFLNSNTATAQTFRLGVSATKLDTSLDGPAFGGSNVTTTTILGLKAGLHFGGLFAGGIYDSNTEETSGTKSERTGYGVVIGYHQSGWFIDGSYFLSSTLKQGSTELTEGSGFGVDVGRNFDVLANVYLGLQISYRSFGYKKNTGVSQDNKIKSELTPMLNVGLAF